MLKTEAIEKLGGSLTAASEAVGITPQAVSQWPDVLPPRIADRVEAAAARIDAQKQRTYKRASGEVVTDQRKA